MLEDDAPPTAEPDDRGNEAPAVGSPPTSPTAAENVAPERAPTATSARPHLLGIGATVTSIGRDLLLVGPSVERHQAIVRGIAFFGQAGCEFGSSSPFHDLGGDTVRATNISGMAGLGAYVASGGVEFHWGIGVRGGVVNLHGTSNVTHGETGSLTSGFVAPAVSLGLRTGVHARTGTAIRLEAGRVSGGVRGRVAGADAIAYYGKYVSLGAYLEL